MNKPMPVQVSEALKMRRRALGLPLVELSLVSGYSVPTLRKAETNCASCKFATVTDVATELGLAIEVKCATSVSVRATQGIRLTVPGPGF